MRLRYSDYEKVFIQPVNNDEKKGRSSEGLWANLACNNKEAPNLQPDRFELKCNPTSLFGFKISTTENPKLYFLI